MICLDTNAVIAILNETSPRVRARFQETVEHGAKVVISVITHHELMFGAAKSARRQLNTQKVTQILEVRNIAVLPFEHDDSQEAADIRAHLQRLGTPIGPYDTLIAGQARARGATLITANTREFDRVPGLQVVDWAL